MPHSRLPTTLIIVQRVRVGRPRPCRYHRAQRCRTSGRAPLDARCEYPRGHAQTSAVDALAGCPCVGRVRAVGLMLPPLSLLRIYIVIYDLYVPV